MKKLTIEKRISRAIAKNTKAVQGTLYVAINGQVVPLGKGPEMKKYASSWRHTVDAKSWHYYPSYKFHKQLRLFEITINHINGSRENIKNDGTSRKWEICDRFFINTDDRTLYDINGHICNCGTIAGKYFYDMKSFVKILYRSCIVENLTAELTKLFDFDPNLPDVYLTPGSWNYSLKFSFADILEVYMKTIKKATSSKTKNIIDELLNRKMKEVTIDFTPDKNYSWGPSRKAFYDSDSKCIRYFTKNEGEYARIYLIDKAQMIALIKSNGNWKRTGAFNACYFDCEIENIEQLINEIPHFDWYKTYLNSYNDNSYCRRIANIRKAIKSTDCEQFTKIGCLNLAKISLHSPYNLGDIADKKQKNICKKYQLTTKQFVLVDAEILKTRYLDIKHIKQILKLNDLRDIDAERFKKYICFISTVGCRALRIDGIRVIDKILKYDNWQYITQLYSDTFSAFNSLSLLNRPNVNINNFHNEAELIRLHDEISELLRIQREEERALYRKNQEEHNKELEKKNKKYDELRKKYLYEDSEYLICLPKKLSELVDEGHNLHHCVGNYVRDHASGDTTILFLREKSAPDTSFYTIEIDSKDRIKQIHGRRNKWLGNNPEAIPFVMKWIRDKGLFCATKILACTAKGYSANNAPMVKLPTID